MAGLSNRSQTIGIDVSGLATEGTVAEFELLFARRALAKLKSRLGRERLIELLTPDTDECEDQFSAWLSQSDGVFRPAMIDMRVTGLSATEFLAYFDSIRREEPKMLAAHPEHFVIAFTEGGFDVIENIGPHISRFDVHFTDADHAVETPLADFPIRMVGHYAARDGTVESHVLHQFRETSDGFDAKLAIYYPAAAPDEVIEGHRQHLAVEFSNWVFAAAATLLNTDP